MNETQQRNCAGTVPAILSCNNTYAPIFSEEFCSMQLITPLRIRRGGELVTQLDFAAISRNISKRIMELTQRYGVIVDEEEVKRINDLAMKINVK